MKKQLAWLMMTLLALFALEMVSCSKSPTGTKEEPVPLDFPALPPAP